MSSANVELVRSIYADWGRGDFSRTAAWADPEMEWIGVDGLIPGRTVGLDAMAAGWREFLSDWDSFRAVGEQYRELDEDRVLVLHRFFGRGRASGLEVGQTGSEGACIFHVRNGAVTKLLLYSVRDNALAATGLSPNDSSTS